MLMTNAVFERKLQQLETKPCVIEAIEIMKAEEYKEFANRLLIDREFIADRKDDMYVDVTGQYHCLLALNEDSGDGILIYSSGYDYARYTSFIPNVKAYIENQLDLIADNIIKEVKENSSNGNCNIEIDEINKKYDISIKENNGIGSMLLSQLEKRDEMQEIRVDDGCFDILLYLDYCENLDETELDQDMEL